MEVYEVNKHKENDYDVPMQDLSKEDDNQGYFNSNYNYKYQHAGSFVESKSGRVLLVIIIVIILLSFGILMGLAIATLYEIGKVQSCDSMNGAVLGAVSSTTSNNNNNDNDNHNDNNPICSCSELVYEMRFMQGQLNQVLNKTVACAVDDNSEILNATETLLKATGDSAQKLINIVNTLSNLQDTSTSTAGVASDILLVAKQLLVLHNDSTALPTSCKQVKQEQPNSPSGTYILSTASGDGTYETYCNMGELCGSGGGWTRLAYLDMTDATENCPSALRLYQSGGVRCCGRPVSGIGSCASVQFPSNGISYSQICGRVTGYQFASTDATVTGNLNSNYVDGVSITRGSPRKHVWTLISGWSDTHNVNPCRCNQQPQAFIGNNYFCESGNPTSNTGQTLFVNDPLWDGQGCGSLELTCCSAPGLPWFHRDYGSTTTTDYIELRVCGDESTANEDVTVGLYEIYVQ
ncbi:PREDICTED: uncharacterized protein LOC109583935 [Amphimedon queenslandica]|uniref:Fibrinogen C-terminal domain-containing protein n=1 Tax=Amphimedon queenslandica TaxID=400682 RepID=A0A1X7UD75_AMPQE|nr:PREDICTED: uncharacterized protein LOC109583935 [Amphimedon queenslandica]|eukprot:XP_019855028.1 PREDICTED: uncharacterized protein LOC109583935 [Amphimedon queenslandica]